jgi:hypothetical protein
MNNDTPSRERHFCHGRAENATLLAVSGEMGH